MILENKENQQRQLTFVNDRIKLATKCNDTVVLNVINQYKEESGITDFSMLTANELWTIRRACSNAVYESLRNYRTVK